MSDGFALLFVASFVGGIVSIALNNRHRLRDHRYVQSLLEQSEPVPIRDARPDRRVRLVGRVTSDGDLVHAPLTGRPCIAWQLVLERVGMADEDGHRATRLVALEESGGTIGLVDDSGHVDVRLNGALWRLGARHEQSLAWDLDRTPATNAFLKRNRIRWSGYGKPAMRFTEQILVRGQELHVVGSGVAQGVVHGGGGAYRDAPTTLLLAASRQRPLLLLGGRDPGLAELPQQDRLSADVLAAARERRDDDGEDEGPDGG